MELSDQIKYLESAMEILKSARLREGETPCEARVDYILTSAYEECLRERDSTYSI